jgi:hypothetical protein
LVRECRYERLQEDFGHAKSTIASLREDVEKFGREAIDNRKKLHEAERRAAIAEDTANRLEAERDRALENLDGARRRIGELEKEAAEERQRHFNQMRELKNAEYRRLWQAQVRACHLLGFNTCQYPACLLLATSRLILSAA